VLLPQGADMPDQGRDLLTAQAVLERGRYTLLLFECVDTELAIIPFLFRHVEDD
jgi:hypothetical protein